MLLLGKPVKLSRTSCGTNTWPPDLGEGTQSPLEEVPGMLPEEASALETSGLVCCGSQPPPRERKEGS